MNNMKKNVKKGFTLVELVIVMAIMSILLVAVMSMTAPASRIFKRTSVGDNSYSIANNIENYLKRNLEYAENVWTFDSRDAMAANIPAAVREFKHSYYQNVCMATSEGLDGHCAYVQGKIHVLHLSNETGMIDHTVYTFLNSSTDVITAGSTETAVEAVNPAYFKGDNARYHIHYAYGATELETVNAGGNVKRNSDTDPFYQLVTERDGENVDGRMNHQALSIVVNKGTVNAGEFEGPAVLTVAPLPFTNISVRNNIPNRRMVQEDGKEGTNDFKIQGDATLGAQYNQAANSFENFAGGGTPLPVSSSQDIYFIYSYADEIKTRR